jgi:hemerythrin-like domain-containing protein
MHLAFQPPVADTSPLESLLREHRVIARVTDALEVCSRHLTTDGDEDRDALNDMRQFVTFFEAFGVLMHNVKEEEVMVPYLVRAGFSYDSGCLGQVRAEHDLENYLLEVMHQAAEQVPRWTREDRRHAVSGIGAFVDFGREHMRVEETTLCPEILARLSRPQLVELALVFQDFDQSAYSHENTDGIMAIARDLIQRYTGRPDMHGGSGRVRDSYGRGEPGTRMATHSPRDDLH